MPIDMGAPVSAQLKIPGVDDGAERLVADAKRWVAGNENAFQRFIRLGKLEMLYSPNRMASPNKVRELCRYGNDAIGGVMVQDRRRCVMIPNAITPVLARLAEKRDPGVKFLKKRSMVDGVEL